MSSGLAPSKTTVYISNLPFSLSNNDIHQVFQEHGKIVKVTVLKDKISRKSKGVAFILFLRREDAAECVKATNGIEMFGRTLKASIATDNGRSAEFIRRREYPDKSNCYECGEEGHLSYQCPRNVLGAREPPPKKQRIRKRKKETDANDSDLETDSEGDTDTLSSVIAEQFSSRDEKDSEKPAPNIRKRIRKDCYFSDEECSD